MKTLIKLSLIVAALGLSACAHERTEMDRELALKLVDKAGRIEIVQTNNGNPSQNLIQPQAQHGPWENYAPQRMPSAQDQSPRSCRSQPMYDLNGNYTHTDVSCF